MADGLKLTGESLRALREETEISARAFARLVGCHPGHYYKLEYGTAQPSKALLNKIVRILGELLGRNVPVAAVADPAPSRRRTAA